MNRMGKKTVSTDHVELQGVSSGGSGFKASLQKTAKAAKKHVIEISTNAVKKLLA